MPSASFAAERNLYSSFTLVWVWKHDWLAVFKITALWDVTPCRFFCRYQMLYAEEEGRVNHRNIIIIFTSQRGITPQFIMKVKVKVPRYKPNRFRGAPVG
jgi:hypothetical protein